MPTPYDTNALVAQTKAMLAQTAAEGTKAFKGSSFDTGTPTTPTGTITPAQLAPKTPIVPVTPVSSTLPTSPTLSTPPVETPVVDNYAPTTGESEISRMIRELNAGTSALGSREAFTESAKAKYDVAAKNALVRSLTTQFQNLQNQAKILPEQIQQAAQEGGANVTKGGLAPIQTAQLRANTIQQYQIAAQHAVATDDLATAMAYVDQAVALEYQPKKDALDAERQNLELLLKDPTLTLEQQKRAAALTKQNEADAKVIAKQEDDAKTIQGLAMQAAQNGAPAPILNAIRNAKDVFEAASAGAGWTAKETAASIQEYNFAVKNGYIGSYTQYQNEDANRKVAIAKAGVAKTATGLPTNIATQVDKLAASFDSSPIVKNYNEVQNKKMSVDSILQTGIKGPADLAIVYEFMKALDPTSVVRETEYSTAAASGNIFSGLYAKFNGYMTEGGGFLPEQVKKDFQTIINKKFESATSQYDNLRKEQARKIDLKTGSNDGLDYLTDYAAAVPTQNTQNHTQSSFDDIQSQLTLDPQNPNTVYISSADWAKLGTRKDALLAEIAAEGGKLLVK